MGKVVVWTDEEIRYLKDNYDTKSAEEIADYLGRPRRGVWLKANRIGLTKKIDAGKFERSAKRLTNAQLAKKYNRSIQAIRNIRYRIGIDGMLSGSDKLTFRDVSRIVHKADTVIGRTWRKRGLKWQQFGKFCLVAEDDLLDFCKDNQDLWNACDCEQYFFQRFDWFEEKRKADFDKMIKERWGCLIQ